MDELDEKEVLDFLRMSDEANQVLLPMCITTAPWTGSMIGKFIRWATPRVNELGGLSENPNVIWRQIERQAREEGLIS